MKHSLSLPFAAAAVLVSAFAGAQTAHVYHHVAGSGQITNTVLCNPACTTPVPQEAVAPGYATSPLTGAVNAPPLGGHALDQSVNTEYVSDGLTIAMQQFHPLYDGSKLCTNTVSCPGFGPGLNGPFTYPHTFPPPFPPTTPNFGNITGMAVRQGNSVCPAALYVTDGTHIMGLQLCPDTPGGWTTGGVVELPFPIPAPGPVGGALLSGLECAVTGIIVACDVNGRTYLIPPPGCSTVASGILGLGLTNNNPIEAPPEVIPGTIIGNVYDRSIPGPGSAPSLYVTDGIRLYPVISPCPLSIPIQVAGQVSRGASFSAEPIVLKACGTEYSDLVIGTTEPIVASKSGYITLSAPTHPNAYALLVYGNCTTNTFFTICQGCVFWIDLLDYGTVAAATNQSGEICLPATIPNVGLTVYLQWAVFDFLHCPVWPHVFFSDALHCRISDS